MQLTYQIINQTTLACQACRGAFEHGGKDATGWAIFFMLCIIIPVLATVGFFIYRIAKRQSAHVDSRFDDPFLNNQNSYK
jgi:hypothetical protein